MRRTRDTRSVRGHRGHIIHSEVAVSGSGGTTTGGPFLLLVDGFSRLLLVNGIDRLLITGKNPGTTPTYYIYGF